MFSVAQWPKFMLRLFVRAAFELPPSVIFALAFNHVIGDAAHSGVSEVLFFMMSYKWKKQLEGNSVRQFGFEDLL